jgi:sec-independent protein translocase protein TatA
MVGDILQPTHLLFVLVVALLVLGPKRLPEVGRTLGNGIRDFRSAINGESTESRDEIESKPWHSDPEPEQKHEFAHDGEPTPESHEFAHEAPAVAATAPDTPPQAVPAPTAAAPAPATQPVDAQPVNKPAQPAATSDTAPDKHEFAYESSEAAENSAGPRT